MPQCGRCPQAIQLWYRFEEKANARKTNAVGEPVAAASARKQIEFRAAAAGRCRLRSALRAGSDWRGAWSRHDGDRPGLINRAGWPARRETAVPARAPG